MRLIMMMFYFLIMLFGVAFAALNAGSVQLNLYFKMYTMPISILLLAALALGVILGFVVFLTRYWSLKAQYRKLKHQLELTEREIKNLRAIPLKDQH
ncbi:MAG: LapA family protein [Legionellaceae bacterium]|nr:LapA family protein [Legionellaceae bacterium]